MACSVIFDGISFFYIARFKGLQAHPMKLFMWISLANFCFIWPTLMVSFICDLDIDDLFVYTLGAERAFNKYLAIEYLVEASLFQITFFYSWLLCLNICLCHDLIMTFRSPFKKPESRYNSYIITSILVALIPSLVRIITLNTVQ